jgi:hypothetical protein
MLVLAVTVFSTCISYLIIIEMKKFKFFCPWIRIWDPDPQPCTTGINFLLYYFCLSAVLSCHNPAGCHIKSIANPQLGKIASFFLLIASYLLIFLIVKLAFL